jgi:hypothetical protein
VLADIHIDAQYERAKRDGWLDHFIAVAGRADFAPHLLLGISSRETNVKNIRGDFREGVYHGFGLMQVDVGTDPDFCREWKPSMVEESIARGAKILDEKRDSLERWRQEDRCVFKTSKGRKFPFTPAIIPDHTTFERIYVAAYNVGIGAYYGYSVHGDPDYCTTGKDYSRDVRDRARRFLSRLVADGLVTEAHYP